MFDNSKEYIICSAIRRIEPHPRAGMVYNDTGSVICGHRHGDILIFNSGIVSKKFEDQGFLTSEGRFVGRKEAAHIAAECGQIDPNNMRYGNKDYLYSEDIY